MPELDADAERFQCPTFEALAIPFLGRLSEKNKIGQKSSTYLHMMKRHPPVDLRNAGLAVQARVEAVRAAKHCADTLTIHTRTNMLVDVVAAAIVAQKLVEKLHAI
jgi:hypothetical protein